MQQLEVRRLTPQESAREQQTFYDVIPPKARIKWITQYLGKTDRTVSRYRKLLFEHCLEFQTLTCINGIDNRILLKRQIELLKELSDLMDIWKDVDLSLTYYGSRHPRPCDN